MHDTFKNAFWLTAAAIGPSVEAAWPAVHRCPEETLQAFPELQAKLLLPVHNGTADLALHGWSKPITLGQTRVSLRGWESLR